MRNDHREYTISLKKQLRHTWNAFFARFGRLTEVQLKTIPVVLSGKNALIVSPTASGKTEAVIAPLLERLCQQENRNIKEGILIVYITPTRALVNDLYFRLHEQAETLGILLSRKTGDNPYLNKNNPPHILITTPESLDSFICRNNKLLQSIIAIIIDEIHLIDGTYRGDQTRLLLNRLFNTMNLTPFIYLLSATISSPEKMGQRYIPADFEIINIQGQRDINTTFISTWAELYGYCKKERLKKLLVFCNYREKVEKTCVEMSNLWGNRCIAAHHGLLGKQEREGAESFMQSTNHGICVATSTMEIGIDIGNIDAVVLAETPWSISSLIQRIGRGNRKSNICRVFAVCSKQDERDYFEYMFTMAKSGILDNALYEPELSVIVQQLFSMVCQIRSGISIDIIQKVFESYCDASILTRIIEHLLDKNWLQKRAEKLYSSTSILDLYEKGTIHSNIPEQQTCKVVYDGKMIGKVYGAIDKFFVLSGKVWAIQAIKGNEILVKPSLLKDVGTAFFNSNQSQHGAFFKYLPEYLKRQYKQ